MPIFQSIQPFVPSGKDFEHSKALFLALGFEIDWENGGYVGFRNGGCIFILYDYDNTTVAENTMLRLVVPNLDNLWAEWQEKAIQQHFNIQLRPPTNYPYGREIHLIDLAGVCWHIAEE